MTIINTGPDVGVVINLPEMFSSNIPSTIPNGNNVYQVTYTPTEEGIHDGILSLSFSNRGDLKDLMAIKGMISLKTLSINLCPNLSNLSGLQNLSNLERLSISNCNKLGKRKFETFL